MYENGHHRSHVTPPPPRNFPYLQFQPVQTKFSHSTFDWNSSFEFENEHQWSNVTPPLKRGFLPLENSINFFFFFFFFFFFLSVTTITLERLNQSKPNFHTRLLTEIARPCMKWASQVTCDPTPNMGLLPPP